MTLLDDFDHQDGGDSVSVATYDNPLFAAKSSEMSLSGSLRMSTNHNNHNLGIQQQQNDEVTTEESSLSADSEEIINADSTPTQARNNTIPQQQQQQEPIATTVTITNSTTAAINNTFHQNKNHRHWKETLQRHCHGRAKEKEAITAFLRNHAPAVSRNIRNSKRSLPTIEERQNNDDDKAFFSDIRDSRRRNKKTSQRHPSISISIRKDSRHDDAYAPVLLLTGPAGVGKTTLMRHAVHEAVGNYVKKTGSWIGTDAEFVPLLNTTTTGSSNSSTPLYPDPSTTTTLVLHGRFDNFDAPLTPYSGWVTALQDLVRQIASTDCRTTTGAGASFLSIQRRLQRVLEKESGLFSDNEAALLISAFPALQTLFTPQNPYPQRTTTTNHSTKPMQQQQSPPHKHKKYDERLGTLLQRFLTTVVQVLKGTETYEQQQHYEYDDDEDEKKNGEVALIICLDNAHLAHNPSLELLSLLVSELPVPGCQWILSGTTASTESETLTSTDEGDDDDEKEDDNDSALAISNDRIASKKEIGCEALWQKLQAMEAMWNTKIERLELVPLSEEDMHEVLWNGVLQLPTERGQEMDPFTQTAHQVTQGNCLHLIWFLQWLEDEEYLVQDNATGEWSCVVDSFSLSMENTVRSPVATESDASLSLQVLVNDQVARPGGLSLDLLQVASCLSRPSFDAKLLARVIASLPPDVNESEPGTSAATPVPVDRLDVSLKQAVAQGFLLPQTNTHPPSFAFANKTIAAMFQQQMSIETRAHIHLLAGRAIWEMADAGEMERIMFTILNHLHKSLSLCREANPLQDFSDALRTRSKKERWAIGALCFHAGNVSAKISSFTESAAAFDFGVQSLAIEDWRENYDLALALHCHAADARVGAAMTNVDDLVEPVLEHARVTTDKVAIVCPQITVLGIQNRHGDAIALALQMLEELDCPVTYPVPKVRLIPRILKLVHRLNRMSDGQILRLPRMANNREQLARLQVIHRLTINCMAHSQPHLLAYISVLTVEITLNHGLTVFAAGGFGLIGMLCSGMQMFDSAFRYGRLAITLLEQFGEIAFLPRVNMTNYGILHAWRRPIRECLSPLLYAYRIGRQVGDIQFAVLCGVKLCSSALESGLPLMEVQRYWKELYHVMMSQNDSLSLCITLPHMQRAHHFLGLSDDPLADKGDLMDYSEALATSSGFQRLMLKYARMQLCYVFNDYSRGYDFIIEPKELRDAPNTLERVSLTYLRAALLLERARMNIKRRANLREVRRIIKYLDRGSKESPHNIADRFYLLTAELSSLTGNDDDAYRQFVIAISVTKREQNLFMHALANERCALHFLRKSSNGKNLLQDETARESARPYLLEALRSYREWGGLAKVKVLRQFFSQQFGQDLSSF